jgi:hypothetical protein
MTEVAAGLKATAFSLCPIIIRTWDFDNHRYISPALVATSDSRITSCGKTCRILVRHGEATNRLCGLVVRLPDC